MILLEKEYLNSFLPNAYILYLNNVVMNTKTRDADTILIIFLRIIERYQAFFLG